ncbi:hypothetical protein P692DRAFT_20823163 [Suillus brevipes Sb2]|nr:hypothetical protein P692DRAFT_20823163 [Suillus brevipes Sb2]
MNAENHQSPLPTRYGPKTVAESLAEEQATNDMAKRKIALPCIALKLAEDNSVSSTLTKSLLLLLANLTPILLPRPTSSVEALQQIQDNLPNGKPESPLVLFPRNEQVTEWYYHIYFTTKEPDERPHHPIIFKIFGKRRCPRGSLLVVKNGDALAPDAAILDMDINELGSTLWWYITTENDPITEASKRRLRHYIKNTKDET